MNKDPRVEAEVQYRQDRVREDWRQWDHRDWWLLLVLLLVVGLILVL